MKNYHSSAAKILPHYTLDEYRLWEGNWELIGGIAYAMAPSPVAEHQYAVAEVLFQIKTQIPEKCPEECQVFTDLDWIISNDTVVRPDVVVICDKIEDYIKTTPEVVFEVVSKATAQKDEHLKFEIYEAEGVTYYVLVYPDLRKARVFRLEGDSYKKLADCTKERFPFSSRCEFEIDFSRLWYR